MTMTRTLPQPVARLSAPFVPPSARPAFQAPLQGTPGAAPAAILAAALVPSPVPRPASIAPAPPPTHGARTARARWSSRIATASLLVIAACALVAVAPNARALSAARESGLLVVGAVALVGAAEGWRRAWSLRAEVSALRAALRVAGEAERWHRAVVEDVNDAVLVASPEGRMMDVNQAATVLLGRDRDWLIGSRLWDILPLDERLVALRRGERVATHGGGVRRLLRPDGSVVAADVSWSTLDDGRIIYLARRFGQW
jgi:PAS domain S-box-containing protein